MENERTFNALANVKKLTGLFGGWEIIHEKPTVVLDVAHNEDGIKQLIIQLSKLSFNHLHIIFGMVKDKEIKKVLCQLPKNATFYFTKAHNPRALNEKELQLMAKQFDLNGETFADVNNALETAMKSSSPDDLIIVCGSIFVIAEVEKPVK